MKVTEAAKKYLRAELDGLSDSDIRKVVQAIQALVDHGLLDGDEPDETDQTDEYINRRGKERVASGKAGPPAYVTEERKG